MDVFQVKLSTVRKLYTLAIITNPLVWIAVVLLAALATAVLSALLLWGIYLWCRKEWGIPDQAPALPCSQTECKECGIQSPETSCPVCLAPKVTFAPQDEYSENALCGQVSPPSGTPAVTTILALTAKAPRKPKRAKKHPKAKATPAKSSPKAAAKKKKSATRPSTQVTT